MFTAKNIIDLVSANPFEPFRICLTDGKTYEVPNHDTALIVTRNYVELGINLDVDGIAESVSTCAIIHITRLEIIPPNGPKVKPKRRPALRG